MFQPPSNCTCGAPKRKEDYAPGVASYACGVLYDEDGWQGLNDSPDHLLRLLIAARKEIARLRRVQDIDP